VSHFYFYFFGWVPPTCSSLPCDNMLLDSGFYATVLQSCNMEHATLWTMVFIFGYVNLFLLLPIGNRRRVRLNACGSNSINGGSLWDPRSRYDARRSSSHHLTCVCSQIYLCLVKRDTQKQH
jgi:hypothetical protein